MLRIYKINIKTIFTYIKSDLTNISFNETSK